MKHVMPARREIGVRTVFNLLGPLTNPAGANAQVIGVAAPGLTETLARVLGELGTFRAFVVHGADGLDEISTTGYTKVSECQSGAVRTFYVHPSEFGLPKSTPDALKGADATHNATIARAILKGEKGAARDIVLLNAGVSLLIAGAAASAADGIRLAAQSIDSGAASAALDRLVKASNG